MRPKRFLGERLGLPARLELPGQPPISIEIYLRGEEAGGDDAGAPGIGVYAAALVADDFHGLAPLDLDHAPWTDSRLTGLVDFPALAARPGAGAASFPTTPRGSSRARCARSKAR